MSTENVIIFGCGAAGSNVFLNLIHVHPALNYTLVDFDKVEARNILPGTQPYSKADLNRPKVQALQMIARQRRDIRAVAVNQKMCSVYNVRELIKSPQTILIDAFDNAPSRNLLFQCDKHPAPTGKESILHIGFSAQMVGEIVWNESYEEMSESKADARIDVCELHLALPFINVLTGMAAKVVSDFILHGRKQSLGFQFNEMKVTKFE